MTESRNLEVDHFRSNWFTLFVLEDHAKQQDRAITYNSIRLNLNATYCSSNRREGYTAQVHSQLEFLF